MPGWFRQGPSPYQTALAMIGAKAGDRVVVAGADDPDLAAELALVTGLNGQTTVYDDRAGARETVEASAGRAGALVEFTETPVTLLPIEASSRDVVVLARPLASIDASGRAAVVGEGMRVLRSGGRIIVFDGIRRSGLVGLFQKKPTRLTAAQVLALLAGAGAKAQRQLAEVDGVAYFEGRKA